MTANKMSTFLLCLISASATASDSHKWGAIAELSEVWANGRYLTPQIACSPNQWDLAFSQSSERIASGLANLEDGKRTLMAASGAYVQSPAAYAYKPQSRGLVNKIAVDKDTSIIRIERELSPSERQQWHDAFTANRVVIDLRSSAGNGIQDIVERSAVFENKLVSVFGKAANILPPVESIQYFGFPTESGFSSGRYRSSLVVSATDQDRKTASDAKDMGHSNLIFIGNKHTFLQRAVLASRLQGGAIFISTDGPFQYGGLPSLETNTLSAEPALRLARFKDYDLERALMPDALIDAKCASNDQCLQQFISTLNIAAPNLQSNANCDVLPATDPVFDTTDDLPTRAGRIYAVAKAFHVLRLFHPLREELTPMLRSAFELSLKQASGAKTSGEYAYAIARMIAPLPDAHIQLYGHSFFSEFGQGDLPVKLVAINSEIFVGCSADKSTLRVGDRIRLIDGKPIADRLKEVSEIVTTKYDADSETVAVRYALRGAIGSEITLDVTSIDQSTRRVVLTRQTRPAYCTLPSSPKMDTKVQWLRKNVAYLNLATVSRGEVNILVDELALAKFLIVDLRGYPQGGAWTLAAHINSKKRFPVAQFITPLVLGRERDLGEFEPEALNLERTQWIDGGEMPNIKAKIIVLIDHNTMSQGEHSVLMLKAASRITTVGSITRGADGDVTNFLLPGALLFSFTGQEVKGLDGKRILGVGIEPDVKAEMRLSDIIEGRDFVLEMALNLTN